MIRVGPERHPHVRGRARTGLEYVVFSERHEGDAEVVQEFWTEED